MDDLVLHNSAITDGMSLTDVDGVPSIDEGSSAARELVDSHPMDDDCDALGLTSRLSPGVQAGADDDGTTVMDLLLQQEQEVNEGLWSEILEDKIIFCESGRTRICRSNRSREYITVFCEVRMVIRDKISCKD